MKHFYLSALLLTAVSALYAQSPGGVGTSLTLWVKPDAGTTASGGLLSSWTYVNDGTKSFTATAGSQPTLTNSSINFLPAVVFTGTQVMDGPTGVNAPITAGNDSYAAFIVWSSTINNDYQRMWQQRNLGSASMSNSDAFAPSTWNNGAYGDETGTPPFQFTCTRPYNINEWNISEFNLKNTATGDLEIVDDRNLTSGGLVINTDPSNVNGPALRNLSDAVNRIGENSDGNQPMRGSIAEIIVYNTEVDAGTARNQIFSYLSMKYGIPIQTNLLNSAGTTIWDATANSSYNNAVFGLAIDNTSGLSTTQATSTATGNGDGTGQSGAANVVLSNPSITTNDKSFLFIGNDNGSLTESTTGAPAYPNNLSIFGRRWKAASTGNLGTVTVSIDYTGLTPQGTGGTSQNFRLIVDETGNNDFVSTPPTVYIPTSVSGNLVTYSNVNLPANSIFTFGSSAVPLPVNWTGLSASLLNGDIKLSWSVTNNQQAKYYQVEHSLDGTNFSKVGTVANDASIQNYSFLYTPATDGVHYFRILETDLDGNSIYSKIISINTGSSFTDFSLKLLGNPIVNGTASFEVDAPTQADAFVEIWSIAGVRILASRQSLNNGVNRIDLPIGNIATGNYILSVKTGSTTLHQQLSKQ